MIPDGAGPRHGAALPRPAPWDLGAGADRRRRAPDARRDLARAPRRPLSRRAARVPARRARGDPPAARGAAGHGRARRRRVRLSERLPARRGDESVPLRLSRRSPEGVRLRRPRARGATRASSPARCSTGSTFTWRWRPFPGGISEPARRARAPRPIRERVRRARVVASARGARRAGVPQRGSVCTRS